MDKGTINLILICITVIICVKLCTDKNQYVKDYNNGGIYEHKGIK